MHLVHVEEREMIID